MINLDPSFVDFLVRLQAVRSVSVDGIKAEGVFISEGFSVCEGRRDFQSCRC